MEHASKQLWHWSGSGSCSLYTCPKRVGNHQVFGSWFHQNFSWKVNKVIYYFMIGSTRIPHWLYIQTVFFSRNLRLLFFQIKLTCTISLETPTIPPQNLPSLGSNLLALQKNLEVIHCSPQQWQSFSQSAWYLCFLGLVIPRCNWFSLVLPGTFLLEKTKSGYIWKMLGLGDIWYHLVNKQEKSASKKMALSSL